MNSGRFFRSWAAVMVLLLAMLQFLTPFLHAHFGSSYVQGWHMHLVDELDEQDVGTNTGPVVSLPHESTAVDVLKGLPPNDPDGDLQPPILWLIASAVLALLPLVRLNLLPGPFGRAHLPAPSRRRRPNALPPSLAPPLSS